MKMLVTTKQIIIQDVQFTVDVPQFVNGVEVESNERYAEAAVILPEEHSGRVELYDASDERIVETIVLSVREAAEEESK